MVNYSGGKVGLNATINITWISNNSFEGNSSPEESTEITRTNHAGRVVALSPPDDLPPPPYSDLYFSPPPSYYEAVGPGVEFAEIPASQPSSIEQDIESAESPSSRALAQRRVEASNSCRHRLRTILTALPPCLVFLLLVVVAVALLLHSELSTH